MTTAEKEQLIEELNRAFPGMKLSGNAEHNVVTFTKDLYDAILPVVTRHYEMAWVEKSVSQQDAQRLKTAAHDMTQRIIEHGLRNLDLPLK